MEENAAMLNELCQRAAKRHITLYSRFLNLAQQREGEIAARRAGAEYCLYGGAQDCERRMLAVSGEDVPDESLFPIACLLAAPRSARFAAPIAHRDVLGALMGLGIERELIGRNVVPGHWTFQLVEEYDDGYYADFRRIEKDARDELVAGRRHLFEAELKEKRRTRGLPGHEAR